MLSKLIDRRSTLCMLVDTWVTPQPTCWDQQSVVYRSTVAGVLVDWGAIGVYNPPINFGAISLATLRHVLDSYHAITPV